MPSVIDIFSAFGGPSSVARVLGIRPSTASEMKRRGSIPAEYWRDLVMAAERMNVKGVDAAALIEAHARDRGGPAGEPPPGASGEDRPAAGGHFSRFRHVRRPHFASGEQAADHVRALRDEWGRR